MKKGRKKKGRRKEKKGRKKKGRRKEKTIKDMR